MLCNINFAKVEQIYYLMKLICKNAQYLFEIVF